MLLFIYYFIRTILRRITISYYELFIKKLTKKITKESDKKNKKIKFKKFFGEVDVLGCYANRGGRV